MNESPESTNTHELPRPHTPETRGQSTPEHQEGSYDGSNETALSNPELDKGGTAAGANGTVPASSTAAPALVPAPAAGQVSASHAHPVIADDGDIIEKEWVEKAKQIVNVTKSDPRTENKEINKFKADYIRKRYNKVIKVNEE